MVEPGKIFVKYKSVFEEPLSYLPLIVTDSTGLAEMIDDDKNGYKVKLEETEDDVKLSEYDLARKMIKLLNNSDLRQIRKNSRKRYLKYYTIDSMQRSIKCLI